MGSRWHILDYGNNAHPQKGQEGLMRVIAWDELLCDECGMSHLGYQITLEYKLLPTYLCKPCMANLYWQLRNRLGDEE